jgi:hypothetical protein
MLDVTVSWFFRGLYEGMEYLRCPGRVSYYLLRVPRYLTLAYGWVPEQERYVREASL